MARTLLVFGDSNSYGTPPMPDLDFWGRFAPGERWPGVALAALGPEWRLVEEALPGRTTVHDDPIEGRDKNGLSGLPIALNSHRPIDLVVIKLGTNDLKARFSVTADDIAASVGVLVATVRASVAGPDGRAPAVLVVTPAPILEVGCLAGMFQGGAEKSQSLSRSFATTMARLKVPVFDAGAVISSDPLDGIHLSREAHAVLGRAVAARIAEGGH